MVVKAVMLYGHRRIVAVRRRQETEVAEIKMLSLS